jgi:oligosaccharide repeat unit polymerase
MRAIFFIPSFYGVLGWTLALVLYLFGPVTWFPISADTMIIFIALYVLYIASIGILSRFFETRYRTPTCPFDIRALIPEILVLHLLGLLGLFVYILDFSRELGGLTEFFFILLSDSLQIRVLAEQTTSLGTQISYAGWIATWLSVYVFRKSTLRLELVILSVLQLLGNMLYIDRTRPMWMMFVAILIGIAASRNVRTSSAIRAFLLTLGLGVVGFCLFLMWTGKGLDRQGSIFDALNAFAEQVSLYGTSGLAYFNHILRSEEVNSFSLQSTLTPIFKLLHQARLAEAPPSLILNFYFLPYPTNVGTSLEPFSRDGGLAFVVFGVVVLTLGNDLIALSFFRRNNPFGLMAWSNLCFMSFISFFTPKFNNFPLYLFIFFGVVRLIIVMPWKQNRVRLWRFSKERKYMLRAIDLPNHR